MWVVKNSWSNSMDISKSSFTLHIWASRKFKINLWFYLVLGFFLKYHRSIRSDRSKKIILKIVRSGRKF